MFDLVRGDADHFGNGIDDQPHHARTAVHDDDARLGGLWGRGHEAPAPKIDDGRDPPAKVRDAFDPWLRARDRGDALHPHNFLDNLDVQAILLTSEREHDDVLFGRGTSFARWALVLFERGLRPGHRRTPEILPCKIRLFILHKA